MFLTVVTLREQIVIASVVELSEYPGNGFTIVQLNSPGGSTVHRGAVRGLLCFAKAFLKQMLKHVKHIAFAKDLLDNTETSSARI